MSAAKIRNVRLLIIAQYVLVAHNLQAILSVGVTEHQVCVLFKRLLLQYVVFQYFYLLLIKFQ